MSAAATLANTIADLQRRLRAVERAPRLARSSIDSGALVVNNANGRLIGRIDADGLLVQSPDSFAHVQAQPFPTAVIVYVGPGITGTPSTIAPGEISASIGDPGGPTEEAFLSMTSPAVNGGTRSSIQLFAEDARAGTPVIVYDAGGGVHSFSNGGVEIDGIGLSPNVPVAHAALTASAFFTATETAVATIPSFTAKADRAYRVEVSGGAQSSGATFVGLRVRQTDASGAQVVSFFRVPLIASGDVGLVYGERWFKRDAPTDLTVDLVLCAYTDTASAGLYGDAANPFVVRVYEAGHAQSFPDVPIIE